MSENNISNFKELSKFISKDSSLEKTIDLVNNTDYTNEHNEKQISIMIHFLETRKRKMAEEWHDKRDFDVEHCNALKKIIQAQKKILDSTKVLWNNKIITFTNENDKKDTRVVRNKFIEITKNSEKLLTDLIKHIDSELKVFKKSITKNNASNLLSNLYDCLEKNQSDSYVMETMEDFRQKIDNDSRSIITILKNSIVNKREFGDYKFKALTLILNLATNSGRSAVFESNKAILEEYLNAKEKDVKKIFDVLSTLSLVDITYKDLIPFIEKKYYSFLEEVSKIAKIKAEGFYDVIKLGDCRAVKILFSNYRVNHGINGEFERSIILSDSVEIYNYFIKEVIITSTTNYQFLSSNKPINGIFLNALEFAFLNDKTNIASYLANMYPFFKNKEISLSEFVKHIKPFLLTTSYIPDFCSAFKNDMFNLLKSMISNITTKEYGIILKKEGVEHLRPVILGAFSDMNEEYMDFFILKKAISYSEDIEKILSFWDDEKLRIKYIKKLHGHIY